MQHVFARFVVIAVFIRELNVIENQTGSLKCQLTRLICGRAANVCLHGVRQGVHARGRGKVRRQRIRELRVQHGVAGNQRKAHNGVFVVRVAIGDNGCQRDFAARACGGGDGNKHRNTTQHAQHAFHLAHGFVGIGNTGADCLCAVHGRAAANGDNAVAIVLVVERQCFLHVIDGGVGKRFVVHGEGNARLAQRFLKRCG